MRPTEHGGRMGPALEISNILKYLRLLFCLLAPARHLASALTATRPVATRPLGAVSGCWPGSLISTCLYFSSGASPESAKEKADDSPGVLRCRGLFWRLLSSSKYFRMSVVSFLCSKSTATHLMSVVACLLELGLNDKDLEVAIMHTSGLLTNSSDRRRACV